MAIPLEQLVLTTIAALEENGHRILVFAPTMRDAEWLMGHRLMLPRRLWLYVAHEHDLHGRRTNSHPRILYGDLWQRRQYRVHRILDLLQHRDLSTTDISPLGRPQAQAIVDALMTATEHPVPTTEGTRP